MGTDMYTRTKIIDTPGHYSKTVEHYQSWYEVSYETVGFGIFFMVWGLCALVSLPYAVILMRENVYMGLPPRLNFNGHTWWHTLIGGLYLGLCCTIIGFFALISSPFLTIWYALKQITGFDGRPHGFHQEANVTYSWLPKAPN